MGILEFSDIIDRDLAHRKKELLSMKMDITSNPRTGTWVSRSAVTLSYAHFEGFVKTTCGRYLEHISKKEVLAKDLKLPLQAVHLRTYFARITNAERFTVFAEIIEEMDTARLKPFKANPNKVIIQNNLSSENFKENIATLGLEYLPFYEVRQHFIDEQLLNCRNLVAHGEVVPYSLSDALERVDGVLELIETFSDQIKKSAHLEGYLRRQ
jgi:hypothetical protein